jgi:hypothetical protein
MVICLGITSLITDISSEMVPAVLPLKTPRSGCARSPRRQTRPKRTASNVRSTGAQCCVRAELLGPLGAALAKKRGRTRDDDSSVLFAQKLMGSASTRRQHHPRIGGESAATVRS